MYIYIATNTVNNKQYVGQSINHPYESRHGRIATHKSAYTDTNFHRAIRKHGFDAFTWEVLWYPYVCQDALNSIERNFIENLNTLSPNGYNLDSGGKSGGSMSVEQRKKLSAIKQGKYRGEKSYHYGKPKSEETRAKISNTLKGRKHTPETRTKIGKSFKGRKHTPETINNMRNAKLGHKNPAYGKPKTAEQRKKISDTLRKRKRKARGQLTLFDD